MTEVSTLPVSNDGRWPLDWFLIFYGSPAVSTASLRDMQMGHFARRHLGFADPFVTHFCLRKPASTLGFSNPSFWAGPLFAGMVSEQSWGGPFVTHFSLDLVASEAWFWGCRFALPQPGHWESHYF
jgi:hypothetical protein